MTGSPKNIRSRSFFLCDHDKAHKGFFLNLWDDVVHRVPPHGEGFFFLKKTYPQKLFHAGRWDFAKQKRLQLKRPLRLCGAKEKKPIGKL